MLSQELLENKDKKISNFDPEKVKEQQFLIADEILYKMNDFCINSPSTTTTIEYLTKQYTKKSDFYYDFVQETNNIQLKALIQLLYDQLESFCINMTILDDSKNFYQRKYEQFIKENAENSNTDLKNYIKQIEKFNNTLQNECEQLRFQLKQKNKMVDNLFADKKFYINSNNNLPHLFKSLELFFSGLQDTDNSNIYKNWVDQVYKFKKEVESMNDFFETKPWQAQEEGYKK